MEKRKASLFDRYIMSFMQLMALIILSPALTDWFQSNLQMFIVMVVVICIGNFFLESVYNNKNYNKQEKAKKMGMLTIPFNTALIVVFSIFLL